MNFKHIPTILVAFLSLAQASFIPVEDIHENLRLAADQASEFAGQAVEGATETFSDFMGIFHDEDNNEDEVLDLSEVNFDSEDDGPDFTRVHPRFSAQQKDFTDLTFFDDLEEATFVTDDPTADRVVPREAQDHGFSHEHGDEFGFEVDDVRGSEEDFESDYEDLVETQVDEEAEEAHDGFPTNDYDDYDVDDVILNPNLGFGFSVGLADNERDQEAEAVAPIEEEVGVEEASVTDEVPENGEAEEVVAPIEVELGVEEPKVPVPEETLFKSAVVDEPVAEVALEEDSGEVEPVSEVSVEQAENEEVSEDVEAVEVTSEPEVSTTEIVTEEVESKHSLEPVQEGTEALLAESEESAVQESVEEQEATEAVNEEVETLDEAEVSEDFIEPENKAFEIVGETEATEVTEDSEDVSVDELAQEQEVAEEKLEAEEEEVAAEEQEILEQADEAEKEAIDRSDEQVEEANEQVEQAGGDVFDTMEPEEPGLLSFLFGKFS